MKIDDHNINKRTEWEIKTPNNEVIYTEKGKNGDADMKIFTKFPKIPWAHSLFYIATCLRLKGMVEDRNYPKGYGAAMLLSFCAEAILRREIPIEDLCKKYKIPERE